MDAAVRELVRRRAEYRCEYCQLPQDATRFFTFHVEHIRARQHKGSDDPENLALACPDCNACKGPNLAAFDPQTDKLVMLFNPRQNRWNEHFEFIGTRIAGITPIGRATVHLLNMNEELRADLREELLSREEL